MLFEILAFQRLKDGLGFSGFSSYFLRMVLALTVADAVAVGFVAGFVSREEGCSDVA